MKRQLIVVACVFAAVVLFFAGCEKMNPQSNDATAKPDVVEQNTVPQGEIPLPSGPGTVATVVFNGTVPISVEIANTKEERSKGLMGRTDLCDKCGMWFEFDQTVNADSSENAFYMKDTLIPLDWIYVNDSMKVVHIKANNQPNDTTPYASPEAFKYVMEIKGGSAATLGIKVGDAVEKRIGPQ